MLFVDRKICVGCGYCIGVCPGFAITMIDGKAHIDPKKCIECGRCVKACPQDAIIAVGKSRPVSSPLRKQKPKSVESGRDKCGCSKQFNFISLGRCLGRLEADRKRRTGRTRR